MTEHKQFVLVEAISQHRMRYLVETPEGKEEWALDTVAMGKAEEFSQKYLGEVIVSSRVIPLDEALDIYRKDNDYLTLWSDEQIIKAGFTLLKDYGNAETQG